jgi:hypothetical protein
MNKLPQRIAFVLMLIGAVSAQAFAQKDGKDTLACRESQSGTRAGHCEIKEQTLPASGGVIKVDGRQNGGVGIKGWERNEVLVRARVQTTAPSQAEADALASQIVINTSGANIFASGPDSRQDYSWSVSFEVFVPTRSDLSLQSHNGGISISDVHGRVDFHQWRLVGAVNRRSLGRRRVGRPNHKWRYQYVDARKLLGSFGDWHR